MSKETPELTQLRQKIQEAQAPQQAAVEFVAQLFQAQTCTLHRWDPEATILVHQASVGVPPPVLPMVERIPPGKGMAGICWERKAPVTVCNLQEDDSGVVRPGAKQTAVEGALVVPMFLGEEMVGTLGVGKAEAYDYSESETHLLEQCGSVIAEIQA